MMKLTVSALAALVTATQGAQLLTADSDVIPGEYIIKLTGRFDGQMIRNHVNKMSSTFGENFRLKKVFSNLAQHGFASYSATLSHEALRFLMNHEDVVEIEENKMMHVFDCVSQSNPWWGLTRTNIRGDYQDGPYKYTTGGTGLGVDVYVIDTGIYCENVEFTGKAQGTCTYGIDLVDGSNEDGNGHGTHVAGTAAGQTYGVAKEANLIAVRVLNDKGSGSTADIIDGVDWVVGNAKKTGRPSVANLSLGGSYSSSMNNAVNSAVDGNVAQIVAAGNSNLNACNYSPASASKAVTVGATEKDDDRASYSNYGNCLDIFGPGTDIKSAWIGSPTATNTISGTSMASPHVCGVAAKYLSVDNSLTSFEVSQKLVDDATENVVNNANGGNALNPSNVSPNLMVYGYCT